jgi:hypothetical protein
MVNYPLKHVGWTILSPQSISRHLVAWTHHILWNGKTSMVTTASVYYLSFSDFKNYPGLLRVLDDLAQYSQSSNDTAALTAVRECRISLEKLVIRMDGLEAGFDRIAERSRK